LPSNESRRASSYEEDLVNYIIDDVRAEVGRTVALLELCRHDPPLSRDRLIDLFPWAPGLKRNNEWKAQRLAVYLRSMADLGLEIPEPVLSDCGAESIQPFPFNEVHYATSKKRLEQSWMDFKKQSEIGREYLCLIDDEESIAAEAFDYGQITYGRAMRDAKMIYDPEDSLNYALIGRDLGPELTGLMEAMHAGAPKDGYRPIAWHNVFWELASEYEALRLDLETRDPYCGRDQELLDHLRIRFKEMQEISRPTLWRRRRRLHDACDDRIRDRLREELAEQ
jgi:hypothetical protein